MKSKDRKITENDLAAYLDGNLSREDFEFHLSSLQHSRRVKNLVELSEKIDRWMERKNTLPILRRLRKQNPMIAGFDAHISFCHNPEMVKYNSAPASSPEPELDCGVIECERVVLRDFCIFKDQATLIRQALSSGLFNADGIEFDQIGLLLENEGLKVTRLYNVDLDAAADFLHHGASLIAVVDGDELSYDNEILSKLYEQDITDGYNPNRAVVIRDIDPRTKMVSIIDPLVDDTKVKVFARSHFEEAWNDSSNFLVIVTAK